MTCFDLTRLSKLYKSECIHSACQEHTEATERRRNAELSVGREQRRRDGERRAVGVGCRLWEKGVVPGDC